MEEVTCKQCSKLFLKRSSQIKKYSNHFCSQSCAATFNNSIRPKRTKTKQNRLCLFCNKEIQKGKNKYCDRQCEYAQKSEHNLQRLKDGKAVSSVTIRKHLTTLKGGFCEICKQGTIWNGELLVLQVDHIDGNSDNNQLENLRLLCPNCHSQTETFATRQVKDTKRNRYLRKYKDGAQSGNRTHHV